MKVWKDENWYPNRHYVAGLQSLQSTFWKPEEFIGT